MKIETIAFIRPLYTIYTETITVVINKQSNHYEISLLISNEGLTYYHNLSLEKHNITFDCMIHSQRNILRIIKINRDNNFYWLIL